MPKFPIESGKTVSFAVARTLAARWFPGTVEVHALTAGGFSGSPVFLVNSSAPKLHVLKAFGGNTTVEQAAWVHRVVQHLRRAGAAEVIPGIRESVDGDALVVTEDGRSWEMAEFVDGVTVDAPLPSPMASAMRALARVHAAAATCREHRPSFAMPQGLALRIERARALSDAPWHARLRTVSWSSDTRYLRRPLTTASDVFGACGGTASLVALAKTRAPSLCCQVVLRDVWSEHVLFRRDREQVTGIIDLHAVGIDTPAMDVARLLGSWMPTPGPIDPTWWASAIDAYETVRSLGDRERLLVPLLAASSIVFGLDNWFHWTLVESRTFPDRNRVVSRIDRLVASLPEALKLMAETASQAGLTLENSSP